MVEAFLDGVQLPEGTEKPKATVRSRGVMDFTRTEFLVHATGDWPIIKEHAEFTGLLGELGPRPHPQRR